MFEARDINKENSNLHHMAEVVALRGPPPRKMLQQSDYASELIRLEIHVHVSEMLDTNLPRLTR